MDLVKKLRILLFLELVVMQSTSFIWILYLFYLFTITSRKSTRRGKKRSWSVISKQPDQFKTLRKLTLLSDKKCIDKLRMDRDSFCRLCYLLELLGGMKNERFVSIPTKVAMFFSIITHHTKNRVVQGDFEVSGHAVSKFFNETLKAVIRISPLLMIEPVSVANDCDAEPWKYFKGCLGALDGTYVDVCVRQKEQPKYRTHKGTISVNVLGVCNQKMNFTYVLAGWEGSAADSRVLRDAVTKANGLKVPTGNYYLADCGYTNADSFLTPYRGVRYHLKEWGVGTLAPQNSKELFNLRHSKARNVIEWAFCLLKGRWVILQSRTFYPIDVQNKTILACALLHNFIRTQMAIDPIEAEVLRRGNLLHNDDSEYIGTVEATPSWRDFRDNKVETMFQSWRHH